MKEQIIFIALIFSLLQPACTNQKQAQDTPDFPPPEVFEAKGYTVPRDKMAPPDITPAIETKSRAVSNPRVTTLKSNVFPVGKPNVIRAGEPKICTPGENGYSLPDTVSAIDSMVPAGLPATVLVNDIQIKDNNSASFTPLNTLNGLLSNLVTPIISDRAGNIWAGCYEGGLSKYDGRSMTNYTSAQGLSDESFNCMMEDSKGNVWLGSWVKGLSRFDGKYFSHYTTKQGLSSNNVISMLEDSKGNLWFGSDGGGINKYDGEHFTHYNTEQGLVHKTVTSIFEDSKGNLWFGTLSGVSRFDGTSFFNYTADQGLSNLHVKAFAEDNNGDLWFCTYNSGIYKYDGKFFEHFSLDQGLPANNLNDIIKDRQGNLWMASWGAGLVKYDRKSFTHFTTEHGLSHNSIGRILQDKNGIFWMSTSGGGIFRFDGEAFTHFIQGEGISHGNFHSIMEDKSGTLWASLFVGGINKYDGKTITEYNVNQGLAGDRVAYSLKDRKGNLWIGSMFGGGLNKYDGKVFTEFEYFRRRNVRTILQDSNGNIWFGTTKGLDRYDGVNFTHFDIAQGLTQGLKNEIINCIVEDKIGNLWLGTAEGVVINFDLSAAGSGRYSFTNYQIAPGTESWVYCATSDKENNLWFSTNNAGAVKFDGKSFTRYTTAQGLSNISVNSIVEDKDGNMWFLTKNGLCKMLPPQTPTTDKTNPRYSQTSLFTNYLFADGFFGAGSQFNTMTADHKGNIWAGVNNRITVYHPEGDMPDTIPPHIELTGVSLFNEKMNWLAVQEKKDTPMLIGNGVRLHDIQFKELGKWHYIPQELKLPYNNNHVTFQFLGITTKKREQVKYKYMLEGFDEKWSSLTGRTEASYTNLPHGKYTFKVKAANSEGYWSDELHYSFAIFPPWWKTWWAYSLFGITAFLAVYGLIRWRLKQKFQLQLAHSEKETQVAEMRQKTAELQQQATELEMVALRATTQEQLMQSEKMASLGELTSGIAHEIKNPLNFINNFSELNMELISEIEEEQLPNLDEKNQAHIVSIIKTLKKNSEKINHHGKRVDGIVKGMLQHSRMSNTTKEAVDINALCDESLKLAWHGFRAKEKTFNASFETRFDPDLPHVRVFPQDFGRVMINLINNAFYAVHEKKRRNHSDSSPDTLQTESLYKPSVIVSTKKNGNKIFITVSDNGMGIPSPIMNKIFQPFFTTKPTGEGTGLGLSMSYDIISKSHGGEIKANSKEGLGTDFEIILPA